MQALPEVLKGLASLAWPVIVVVVLLRFRTSIDHFIDSAKLRKTTVKVAGIELTLDEAAEQQNTILADLQNQVIEMNKRLDAIAVPSG